MATYAEIVKQWQAAAQQQAWQSYIGAQLMLIAKDTPESTVKFSDLEERLGFDLGDDRIKELFEFAFEYGYNHGHHVALAESIAH